jgi:ABC-type antimicrobial peptide transport system permease subunit
MLLLRAFTGLALFLSALDIYGMRTYDVSQRIREIGVRGAISASRGQIASLILRQGLWKGGIGMVLGLIGAAATEIEPVFRIVMLTLAAGIITVFVSSR